MTSNAGFSQSCGSADESILRDMVANFAARGTDMAHSLASQSFGLGKQEHLLGRPEHVVNHRSLDQLNHRSSLRFLMVPV